MDNVTRTRLIVATNVKQIREAKGLSVIACAGELGVGRQYWYLIESGGGNLPLDRLERVARILGVTVRDLLEPPPPKGRGKRELTGAKK